LAESFKVNPSIWGATALVLAFGYFVLRKKSTIPGPRAYPIIGNMLDMLPFAKTKQHHVMFCEFFEKYGDIYRLVIGNDEIIVVCDPAAIKWILTDASTFVRNDNLQKTVLDIMPNGLFALPSGDGWKRHRKLLQPAFGPSHLRFSAVCTAEICKDLVAYLDLVAASADPVVDFHNLLSFVSMDVIGMVGFGHDFKSIRALIDQKEPEAPEKLEVLARAVATRLFTPKFFWPLTDSPIGDKKVADAVSFIGDIVIQMAKERKDAAENSAVEKKDFDKDVVERLVLSKTEDGKPVFSEKEILDELLGFFVAGQETTGNSMTCILYELAKHPEVVAKIRQEYESHSHVGPLYDLLPKLKYLDMVIKEGQRMHTIAGRTARVTTQPVNILGHDIGANALILTGFHILHKHPKYWKDPQVFNPDRFLEPVVPNTFLPFGDGPMNCIGQKLALIESKIVLLKLVENFDFSLVPGETYLPVTILTYGFKTGMKLHVSKRAGH
jgi:cytochrome P450